MTAGRLAAAFLVAASGCAPSPLDSESPRTRSSELGWALQQRLAAPNGDNAALFGRAVQLTGDTAIVGSPHDGSGPNRGSVHVFRRASGTWSHAQMLTQSSAKGDAFGQSLARWGSELVVGAPAWLVGVDEGAVYTYSESGGAFVEGAIVEPMDGAVNDDFGLTVALEGDTLLVSARSAAYAFDRDGAGWTQNAKLISEPVVDSVSLEGDLAVVDHHVFERSGMAWSKTAELSATDEQLSAHTVATAIAGGAIFVGVPQHRHAGDISGAVFVFERSGASWAQTAELRGNDAADDQNFGTALSAEQQLLLVGARTHAAYVFTKTGATWTQQALLTPVAPPAPNSYAIAVSSDAGRHLVGDWGKLGSNPGFADVFDRVGDACSSPAQCWTGFCADGVCCDRACDAPCEGCTAAKGASTDGLCGPIADGTDPDDDCTGGFACVAGACPSSCTSNAECEASAYCDEASGSCLSDLPAGSSCTSASQCSTGICIDAVCCDAPCDGECEACSAAKKGAGSDGTCGPVAADTDPDDECPESPGFPVSCGADGACNGGGACRSFAKAGTPCAESGCVGDSVAEGTCNGVGDCTPESSSQSCEPYTCRSASCLDSCASDADCADDARCAAGSVCVTLTGLGETCGDDAECASGMCSDGVCCNGRCDGQCEVCDVPGAEGTCAPITGAPRGGRPPCSSGQGDPCLATACDGETRDRCAGLVGPAVTCRAPTCMDDVAVLPGVCDGKGACSKLDTVFCSPYQCDGDACATGPCATSADCADGFACDEGTSECLPAGQAVCIDAVTVETASGEIADCSPYPCRDGSCETECLASVDCVPGFVCDRADKRCVAASTDTPTRDSGCTLSPGRAPERRAPWLLIGLALMAARRRLPHPLSRPTSRHLHGAFARPQDPRRLGPGVLEDVAQQKHPKLRGRQRALEER